MDQLSLNDFETGNRSSMLSWVRAASKTSVRRAFQASGWEVGACQPLTYGPAAADADRGRHATLNFAFFSNEGHGGDEGQSASLEFLHDMHPAASVPIESGQRPRISVGCEEYDQAMELQTRPVGGRYTAVKLRLLRSVADGAPVLCQRLAVAVFGLRGTGLPPPARLLQRSTSAGFLRGCAELHSFHTGGVKHVEAVAQANRQSLVLMAGGPDFRDDDDEEDPLDAFMA
ncbi:hypothetical protein AK812_SmicGene38666 [Symbiodinium microadriaticum]|uniref:Uncharacterized protein n=1 Tax=Symbiodinium microadriaticum TaxID=2951 RepID=A0A1Q9CD69_SYMMI|nr:hypothetical protein AK812_SmicGene38666 [Symbiodinium microadriaticum]